ncbi:MAG: alanine racemase [Deltaproteobacteria bacterium]|nr:alanine racemase [Deltaproteobacteria bacterium]
MSKVPRAVAYIDLHALEYNCQSIRSHLSPGAGLLGVVKADAYGHGAVEISKKLESIGIDYLGVATIDEGINLRSGGIIKPILIMSGIFSWDDIGPVIRYDLTPVVYDRAILVKLVEATRGFTKPLRIHLKFDTGMGRLGFQPYEAREIAQMLDDARGIHVEGLMSHFSVSEIRDEYGLLQVTAFRAIIDTFRSAGFDPAYIHMSNSGAIINYPEAHFSLVRAGISLYGSHPSLSLEGSLPLRQVMKLSARIAFCREFPAGVSLSYGRTFTTGRPSKIAYIPIGYSDGYPRSLSNKGAVLINDTRCNIVGRVCMDWILADVTGLGPVKSGDEAVLLGEGDREGVRVSANEMAENAGTIPYEILCKISRRIERVYGIFTSG